MLRCSRSYHVILLAIPLLTCPTPAFAQTETPAPRPKIGLALSGGAALGLAQVGVLEWLYDHHIPVDYIAGTSMGGVLAGGFAVGMTPAELHTLLQSLDWDTLLDGKPPYRTLPLRRKEDQHDLQSRLVVGLRNGVQFPSSLNSANGVDMLLSRISLPYSQLKSFDELPTPLRCMVVDMRTGQSVTLKDGSLASALRATMSIPTVFAPVERDGTLYTDGGTLNNIPTEAVRGMGADVIVAVDLSSAFLTQTPNASLFGVLNRTIEVSNYANERRSLKLANFILTPDVRGFNFQDFASVDALAERGYQAAEADKASLEQLALSDKDWQEYVARRTSRKRTPLREASFIDVIGVSEARARELEKRLHRFVHVPLDTRDLDRELTAITGEGRYDSFLYAADQHGDQTGLVIVPNEESYGPPVLRFGLDINGADPDNIQTNFNARYTALDVGHPGAEVRADLRAGSDRDLAFEYYRPFSNGAPFLAPRIEAREDNIGLYAGGSRVATYSIRTTGAGLDIGDNTSRDSQLRFGYQTESEQSSVITGSEALPSLHGIANSLRLGWVLDEQDSPTIPSRGTRIAVESRRYFQSPGQSATIQTADVNVSTFYPYRKGDSVFCVVGAGTAFGKTVGPLQQYAVGGPTSLAAYAPDEFRGNDFADLTLGYLHRVSELPAVLGGKVMLGGFYQVGGAFQKKASLAGVDSAGNNLQSLGSGRYLNDISVGVLADTLIGPVTIGYGYGEAGRSRVYFAIGGLF